MSFFDKLKSGLSKTRKSVMGKIDQLLASFGVIDEDLFEELGDILISSDVGVKSTDYLIEKLKADVKTQKISDAKLIKDLLKDEIIQILTSVDNGININETPVVITVIGVNGVGKTTSIGKLAHLYKSNGAKVLLAAGDTFRAAAIEQLEVWADRAGVDLIKQNEGSDPAAVIFDATQAAKSRKADVLICDTAGRLHTKKNLMEELKKINRIIDREMSGIKRENLIVLDATTGQNAVNQAKEFSDVTDISGIILTKLDGTAKGGIVISIAHELGIPVKLVGVGEQMGDLQPFVAKDFVDAMFEQ